MTADRTQNSHAAILAPTATLYPRAAPHHPPYPVCPTLCVPPVPYRSCVAGLREREVPSRMRTRAPLGFNLQGRRDRLLRFG